jgi:pimeloyl-ACP methyl ester carboxylesterase
MTRTDTIAGRAVLVDEPAGPASDTLVLLHGWPDTAALWDGTVAALSPRFRCVRFTWPGFAPDDADRAPTLDDLVQLLHQVVLTVAGGQPVTLVLHDWGCVFGYHFARLHPQLVRRVVGVDVGDAGSPAHVAALNWKAKAGIAGYQLWLALAWKWGGTLGDGMARRMAAALRVPVPPADIRARMGHPYWRAWTGGYRATRPFEPAVPMLFVYGRRKPFLFHSRAWAERLAARPGSRVLEMKTGHWVMVDAPDEFQRVLADWLG